MILTIQSMATDGKESLDKCLDPWYTYLMETIKQMVLIRFDGAQTDMMPEDADNLCFTFLTHFIGIDGRDYHKSSWVGVIGLLKAGVNLEDCVVEPRERGIK